MINYATMKKNSFAFSLIFEGLALNDHTMAVDSFAPALLSLNNALVAINKKANQDAVDVKLRVNAQFIAGSFGVELALDQSTLTAVTSMLTMDKAVAFANAYAIFCALRDLIKLKKFLKGRKPDSYTIEDDKVKYTIKNDVCIISVLAHEAFNDGLINEACNNIVTPLAEAGIERVRFRSKDADDFVIEENELKGFVASSSPRILSENISSKVCLQITSLNFNEGTKWRVSLGDKKPIFTSISDQHFLKRINLGQESFAKGDLLVVDLKFTQTIQDGNIAATYDIVKVWEHLHTFNDEYRF